MRRIPLPPSLPATFTVSQARDAGVGRGRLRARDLRRPVRGVYTVDTADDLVSRAGALLPVLPPGSGYSHRTGARLWHLPLPSGTDSDLEVTIPPGAHRIRRAGIRCYRAERPVAQHSSGLPVIEPSATWCDLAETLGVVDLVVLGDAIAGRERSADSLTYAVATRTGHRGIVRAREALNLVRVGSGSPQETRGRLMFREWGLPEPELNVDVHDESGWLATVDYLWREQRVVGEYYGEVHAASWRQDLGRTGLLEDAHLTVVVMTKHDFGPGRERLRARLRRLLL